MRANPVDDIWRIEGFPPHARIESDGGLSGLQPSCSRAPHLHGGVQETVEGQGPQSGSSPWLEDAHLPHLHGRTEIDGRLTQRRKGRDLRRAWT